MVIRRDRYLNKLIEKKENGLVKVITGIRRCGKSFLLFRLYHDYLNSTGVRDGHIIEPAPDEAASARYRNPLNLDRFFREQVKDGAEQYYVFLDEIQEVADIRNPYLDSPDAEIGFTDVLLSLMRLRNVDLYGTGSSSHLLSSDIMTEFRRRGMRSV